MKSPTHFIKSLVKPSGTRLETWQTLPEKINMFTKCFMHEDFKEHRFLKASCIELSKNTISCF